MGDAEEVQRTLCDPAHADVDVTAFEDYLRSDHGTADELIGGGEPPPSVHGVLLWQDAVIARKSLELHGCAGSCVWKVERGARIRVLKRAGLDDMWEGEHDGHQGLFARRLV